MPNTFSPLRYPGGKTQLFPIIFNLLSCNSLLNGTYIEPFAGGAGLAIKLLLKKVVNKIIINDVDPAIYAIWYSIINYTDKFCRFIEKVDLTIQEWEYHRYIYNNSSNIFELGFSSFYLNRTNISGIIKGGVIGGKNQSGYFKMDSRFNKKSLIKKIQLISDYKESISIFNKDIFDFLEYISLIKDKSFINFDPPYVKKGKYLYRNSFNQQTHLDLADRILSINNYWIVTYDICEFIKNAYTSQRYSTLDINYSIGSKRSAKEYLFYSDKLQLPSQFTFTLPS